MKISVIMLTYNRLEYLRKVIANVLNQTMPDFEFIIVNNGSDDESQKLIEQYARQDGRIRLISLNKSSIALGRTAGLKAAVGDYIAFIDDDDWFAVDYLQSMLDCAKNAQAELVFCGSYKSEKGIVSDNCVPISSGEVSAQEAVIKLLQRKECNAALPSKLIKREVFDDVEFPPESVHEDIFVTYKLFAKAKKVAVLKEKKYCFVRHGKNISAFTTNDKLLSPAQLDEYFNAFRERTLYLKRKLPEIGEYAQYSEWSYMISMCNKIESNQLENCAKQLEYIKKELLKNYDVFYNSEYIQDFEKEWMTRYIGPEKDL